MDSTKNERRRMRRRDLVAHAENLAWLREHDQAEAARQLALMQAERDGLRKAVVVLTNQVSSVTADRKFLQARNTLHAQVLADRNREVEQFRERLDKAHAAYGEAVTSDIEAEIAAFLDHPSNGGAL